MLKNITLSADPQLIEAARDRARSQHTTLNAVFRDWLARYVAQQGAPQRYEALMESLSEVDSGGRFTRDELNER